MDSKKVAVVSTTALEGDINDGAPSSQGVSGLSSSGRLNDESEQEMFIAGSKDPEDENKLVKGGVVIRDGECGLPNSQDLVADSLKEMMLHVMWLASKTIKTQL